jgi:6-methylsalicylate decarboxylase
MDFMRNPPKPDKKHRVRIDVHQHVWTAPLVSALERRESLPFVRRHGSLCVVHAAGEAPSAIDLDAVQPVRRRALLARDGVDRALVALSSPLGIEALPRRQARALIDAHLTGVAALGEGFGSWGPLPLDGIAPRDVDLALAHGCVGVSLPAGAFTPPHLSRRLDDVLAHIEARAATLFVHPGPGLARRPPEFSLDDPLWWPALTEYVTQMSEAWLSFTAIVRRTHPALRVVFAMLAGGAPLLSERLLARGGPPVDLRDPLVFYDTSSFGPAAIESMAQLVGRDQLVYGSDRPVVEPAPVASLLENADWLAHPPAIAA